MKNPELSYVLDHPTEYGHPHSTTIAWAHRGDGSSYWVQKHLDDEEPRANLREARERGDTIIMLDI